MKSINQKSIILALLNLGIISILAQVLLIRELVISFYGNELFIGLILAFWLISTGIGSLLALPLITLTSRQPRLLSQAKFGGQASPSPKLYLGQAKGGRDKERGIKEKKNSKRCGILFWLHLFIPMILACAVILSRIARVVLGEAGVMPNLILASLWSLLVIAPVGLLLGALFVALARQLGKGDKAVTFSYIMESMGFFIGAILFSFVLYQFVSLSVIFLIAVFSFVLALIFSFGLGLKKSIIIAVLIIIVAASLIKTDLIDQQFSKRLYPGQDLIESVNSKYGTIHITKTGEQTNFYYNGRLLDNSQNKYHNELLVHLPMLLSDNPKTVLVIGNAFTGLIKELSKYQLEKIIYLELDKELVRLGFAANKKTDKAKLDNKLEIVNQDARRYLAKTDQSFDVIIINYSNPSTLAENRYFTKEFFSLVKSRLNQQGIAAIKIRTTPNYTIGAQNELLITLYQTLKSAMPHTIALPDNEVVFLAAIKQIHYNSSKISKKYNELNLNNQYIFPEYIDWRFTNDRARTLNKQLSPLWRDPAHKYYNKVAGQIENASINSDFKPILYYQQLKIFLEKMEIKYWKIIASLVIFIFLIWLLKIVWKLEIGNWKLLFISAIPEFCLMSFEILLILLFQTFHGYLYAQLSLIIALVLIGIALGSLVFRKLLEKNNASQILKWSYLIIIIAFAAPFIITWQFSFLFSYKFIYYFFSLLAGFAIGTKFPVINKLYLKNPLAGRTGPPVRAGNLGAVYGADLIGGAIGALLAGIFMLPVLGVVGSLGVMVGLCGAGLILILGKSF